MKHDWEPVDNQGYTMECGRCGAHIYIESPEWDKEIDADCPGTYLTKMFDYDEDAMKAAETLDKYDFTDILKDCRCTDIYDVTDKIYDSRICNTEIVDAIEDLSYYELAMYLAEKYEMRYEEITRHCLWWGQKNGG